MKSGALEINNLTKTRINNKHLERVALVIKNKEKFDNKISLVIVGDKLIRSLNKKYRQQDKVTDVLSFLYKGKIDERRVDEYLGEIVICYPQAVRQALRFGGPACRQGEKVVRAKSIKSKDVLIKDELTCLLLHGILHLLGYDHETVKGTEEMENREQKLLNLFKGKN